MTDIIELDKAKTIKKRVQERIDEEIDNFPERQPGTELSKKFIRECLNANELGDGILFRAIHEGKYVANKTTGEILKFNGNHWEIDAVGEIYSAVDDVALAYAKILPQKKDLEDPAKTKKANRLRKAIERRVKQLRSTARQNNVVTQATRGHGSMAVQNHEIDQRPMLLACRNCVVDLETGGPRSGGPGDYLLKASPVEYHGVDVPCPVWEETVSKIFADEVEKVEFLQRILGYSLIGEVREHRFFLFYGPQGRNGKTTIAETMQEILGPLAGVIASEMLMESWRPQNASAPSPDIMGLKGLLAAFASESDQNRKLSPSRTKWITGGDYLKGRNPHDKYETTFRPTHTLFLLTNHLPRLDAQDDAVWERMVKIKLDQRFLDHPNPLLANEHKKDPMLKQKLKKEFPGILGWLVEGCLLYQRDGLAIPESIMEDTREYKRSENFFGSWREDCTIVNQGGFVQCTTAYQSFESWHSENIGGYTPTQRKFSSWAKQEFNGGEELRIKGDRVYTGFLLKDELV
jgi:putative DNA primase/helicase